MSRHEHHATRATGGGESAISVATYGEHAENAAQALNVLIRADEIPTDAAAVDQMLHCREDDSYPPADHLPARTPKPMLAGLDERLASLVDNIAFALPSLPFDERRPPSEVLGIESPDATVETWRAAGIELLAASHALSAAAEQPWRADPHPTRRNHPREDRLSPTEPTC